MNITDFNRTQQLGGTTTTNELDVGQDCVSPLVDVLTGFPRPGEKKKQHNEGGPYRPKMSSDVN